MLHKNPIKSRINAFIVLFSAFHLNEMGWISGKRVKQTLCFSAFTRDMFLPFTLCSVALLLVSTATVSAERCTLLINEINVEEPNVGDFNEYIELRQVNCPANSPPSLRPYVVLIVKEYDEIHKAPLIILSADLYHKTFKTGSQYFVIGSHSETLNPDQSFEDCAVMFGKKCKFTAKNQPSISSFFTRTSAPTCAKDVLPNGSKYAMAVLLRQENRRADEGISLTRLTFRDAASKREKPEEFKVIDRAIENIIKDNIQDMVIYSRRAAFNRYV